MLSQGRNRNVRFRLPGPDPAQDLVAKAFGRQTLLKDLLDRFRRTKAARTWAAACALRDGGIGTPRPVGYLDRWEGLRLRESYYLSEFQPGTASFRDELIRLLRDDPDCAKLMSLMQTVAEAVRRMHDAGSCTATWAIRISSCAGVVTRTGATCSSSI